MRNIIIYTPVYKLILKLLNSFENFFMSVQLNKPIQSGKTDPFFVWLTHLVNKHKVVDDGILNFNIKASVPSIYSYQIAKKKNRIWSESSVSLKVQEWGEKFI